MKRITLPVSGLTTLTLLTLFVVTSHGSPWTGFVKPSESYPAQTFLRDVEIPMDDGTVLRANVTLPASADGSQAPGRFPVVVEQTCYSKDGFTGLGDIGRYPRHGYVHVLVDVRGTGTSEGRFFALDDREARDGYLVVEWAARQPWSSGSVGVTGFSYMGVSATHTAETRPPSLKAIFNGGSPSDLYREFIAAGGVWSYSSVLWNQLANSGSKLEGSFREEFVEGMESGEWNWENDLWKERSVDVTRFDAPTLVYTGWEDIFFRSTLRQYRDLRMSPGRKLAVVGPWVHYTFPKRIGPTEAETMDDLEIAWFDRWLKGIRNGIEKLGPVILFDQGVDEWSSYSQWPPEGVRYERLYLNGRASGSATSLNDGGLSGSVPTRGNDTGLSDPDAGACSRSLIQFTAGAVSPTSPCNLDQRPEERTAFTYTTEPLESALHLNGPLAVTLRGSSTAIDPIWVARLSDVAPDGTSVPITQGSLLASRRALDRKRTSFAINGDAVEPFHFHTPETSKPTVAGVKHVVNVELWATDWVFKPGHRLRLTIAGNDTPHLVATEGSSENRGVHTVYYGTGQASFLTIPVLDSASDQQRRRCLARRPSRANGSDCPRAIARR